MYIDDLDYALNLHNVEREIAVLTVNRNTYMNQAAEYKGQFQYWKKRAEKSEKKMKEMENQMAALKDLAGL
jgi:hypothetical protein